MNTPKEQICEDIRISLFDAKVPLDAIRIVESALDLHLSKYDIIERERALVVYDEGDTDIIKKFFVAKAVQGCTEGTLTNYKRTIKWATSTIRKHLKDITSDDLRALFAWLKLKQCSSAHIATTQRALSSFFTWCDLNGYVSPNPMKKVERTKVRNKIEEALSLEQMEAIRAAAKTKRDKAFIEMLYSTGCRVSELCALNRDDIDWDKMEAQVLGKGKKYRIVYITQRAKYAYLDYLSVRKDKSPALFGYNTEDPRSGRESVKHLVARSGREYDPDKGRMSKDDAGAMFRHIGYTLGFRVHPHLIRKTMATQAMMRGMPIDEVRIMLGHESIATTTIYAQTLKDNIKESHTKYL